MLLKRIIPCLDVDQGRVVKGTNFVDIRDAGDPIELAAHYDREGADEVVFLDITASHEKRDTIVELAGAAPRSSLYLSRSGAASGAKTTSGPCWRPAQTKSRSTRRPSSDPGLISVCARRFGSQCVVIAIDAKRTTAQGEAPRWEAYLNGGRIPTGLDAVEWAARAVALGAGEILLTSMDRDGTKDGYDLELTAAVAAAVNVPVIASGGAGTLDHLVEVVRRGGADAVLAASIFHYGEYSIRQAKEYLAAAGIPVRL